MRGVEKYFSVNGVNALDRADFDLYPGEIHALLGENGAGKSTLMQILAGYLEPGAGRIVADRGETPRPRAEDPSGGEAAFPLHFRSPAEALNWGIGMVRQYPRLTAGFTVWEDCILGAEPRRGPFIRRRAARNLVAGLSRQWNFDLPVDQNTGTLTASQKQKAAILALLLRNVRYLIFDEPAAALTPHETELLFELLRRLRSQGKGIVLISHKLEETLALADRVTVLRRGRSVASLPASSLSTGELGALMFGREEAAREIRPGRRGGAGGEELLVMEKVSMDTPGRPVIREFSLSLRGGTITGIAGVRDSGLETLERTLTGIERPSAGRILLRGKDIGGRGPGAFRRAGGAFLSAGGARAARLPLKDSIIIHAHRRSLQGLGGKLGIMDRRFLGLWIGRVLKRAGLEKTAPGLRGDSLSGGMQRRIALARELEEGSRVLSLSEPGWGLDLKSRERLGRELRDLAQNGRGIIVFSTDVDELISLCDEILVLRNGLLQDHIEGCGELDEGELRRRIGRAMVGEVLHA